MTNERQIFINDKIFPEAECKGKTIEEWTAFITEKMPDLPENAIVDIYKSVNKEEKNNE